MRNRNIKIALFSSSLDLSFTIFQEEHVSFFHFKLDNAVKFLFFLSFLFCFASSNIFTKKMLHLVNIFFSDVDFVK